MVREETRRRIVRSTAELHLKHGILGTTHAMVAQRADVSIPTVYNHFPTRSALVKACGAHLSAGAPPFRPESIDRQPSLRKRIEELVNQVSTVHEYWAPGLTRVLHETERVPELRRFLDQGRVRRRELFWLAVSPVRRRDAIPAPLLTICEELLEFPVWKALAIDRSLATRDVRQCLADAINALLRLELSNRRRKASSRGGRGDQQSRIRNSDR